MTVVPAKTIADISTIKDIASLSRGEKKWLMDNFDIIRETLKDGVSGTFTTTDAKTVTVTNGIITDIT